MGLLTGVMVPHSWVVLLLLVVVTSVPLVHIATVGRLTPDDGLRVEAVTHRWVTKGLGGGLCRTNPPLELMVVKPFSSQTKLAH